MENIKNLISKKVISLAGDCVGYILNVVFDENFKTLKGFVVVDDESENTYFLDRKKMTAVGEECVLIEENEDVELYIPLSNLTPLGMNVYSLSGASLGKVRDVIVERFSVKKVVTDKGEILPNLISSVGKDCIILGKKKAKKKIIFSQKTGIANKVFIVGEQQKNENIHIKKEEKSITLNPARIISNINSVIGKKAKENIIGLNNEIIIKKGEKITKNTINKAIIHGKSNLLIFYSE